MYQHIVVIFVALYVFPMLLRRWHHWRTLNHLDKYKCNPDLYNLIKEAKDHTKGYTEVPRIETSVKDKKSGRYTVPVSYEEFKRYPEKYKTRLLKPFNGVNLKDVDGGLKDGSDIIFGVDGPIGKLYIDHGTNPMKITCYETTGKVKVYCEVDDNKGKNIMKTLLMTDNQGNTKRHYYLKRPIKSERGDDTYWMADNDQYYTRPALPGQEYIDLMSLITS